MAQLAISARAYVSLRRPCISAWPTSGGTRITSSLAMAGFFQKTHKVLVCLLVLLIFIIWDGFAKRICKIMQNYSSPWSPVCFLESFLESNSPMQILLEFHAQTRQETPYDIKQSKGDAPILQDSTTPSIASSRANASSSFTTCQAVARPTLKLRNHSFGRHTTAVSKLKGNCRQRTGGTAL